ncbi:lymphocyte antigen 6E-like protein [Cricetulus griseus]|uniref:Lymphocyte antigen 6E-like protein n=1 Tax=Cricetulus griseus TaxID=10029 RepID=A0A061IIT9_CRIGR|nr:lymphocyte antigen 6E-like protein [Cricetulus griseus]
MVTVDRLIALNWFPTTPLVPSLSLSGRSCCESSDGRLLWLVRPQQMSATFNMRVFLPVLLAALLGVEQAHSLICFSCTDQKSNMKCLWPTVCPSSDNYCVTVSAAAGFGDAHYVLPLNLTLHTGNVNLGYTLNKGCSEICPRENINVNLGVASINSYCCQHSFCNISTAGLGLRASIPLLGLGLLLSLLALLQLDP